MAAIANASTLVAEVERVLEDLFSTVPKGSYIKWHTDLYNVGIAEYVFKPTRHWRDDVPWSNVMPDVIASGVEARLKRDPSLARLEGRVKKVTGNATALLYRKEMNEHIGISFTKAKVACRTKALSWKMFQKSSEARGLPKDLLDLVNVLA